MRLIATANNRHQVASLRRANMNTKEEEATQLLTRPDAVLIGRIIASR
jgi:hypothetical protein